MHLFMALGMIKLLIIFDCLAFLHIITRNSVPAFPSHSTWQFDQVELQNLLRLGFPQES
jgi:hypothetical protein